MGEGGVGQPVHRPSIFSLEIDERERGIYKRPLDSQTSTITSSARESTSFWRENCVIAVVILQRGLARTASATGWGEERKTKSFFSGVSRSFSHSALAPTRSFRSQTRRKKQRKNVFWQDRSWGRRSWAQRTFFNNFVFLIKHYFSDFRARLGYELSF